jgi:hypothetical protein
MLSPSHGFSQSYELVLLVFCHFPYEQRRAFSSWGTD